MLTLDKFRLYYEDLKFKGKYLIRGRRRAQKS